MTSYLKKIILISVVVTGITYIHFGEYVTPYLKGFYRQMEGFYISAMQKESDINQEDQKDISTSVKEIITDSNNDNLKQPDSTEKDSNNKVDSEKNSIDEASKSNAKYDNNDTEDKNVENEFLQEITIEKIHLMFELVKLLGDLETAILTEDQDAIYVLKDIKSLTENTEFEVLIQQLGEDFNQYIEITNSQSTKLLFPYDNKWVNWMSNFIKVEIQKQDDQEESMDNFVTQIRDLKDKLSNKNTLRGLINAK